MSKKPASTMNKLHDKIESQLHELRKDFKQLGSDLRSANEEELQAHRDRVDGFKKVLQDIVSSADRSEREWH